LRGCLFRGSGSRPTAAGSSSPTRSKTTCASGGSSSDLTGPAPHLNGKVERVQRTALEEFWPTVDPKNPDLAVQLEAWRAFYNHDRPHSSLGGRTPAERLAELATRIPAPEAIQATYDPSREFIRSPNTRYRWLPTKARVT
jgi:hypothetical protein